MLLVLVQVLVGTKVIFLVELIARGIFGRSMGNQRGPTGHQSNDTIAWGRKVLMAMTLAPMVKSKTKDRGKSTTMSMRLALESIKSG